MRGLMQREAPVTEGAAALLELPGWDRARVAAGTWAEEVKGRSWDAPSPGWQAKGVWLRHR